MLSSGLRKELLEILQEIWRATKQVSDLGVYVLNGLRLSLVRLEYLQEVLINVRVSRESILGYY